MGKIAFVFPGQGSQYSGMGRELFELSPGAAEVFRKADACRPGTSEQCFSGGDDILKETRNTQPCMFAVELAAAAALTEAGIYPEMTAGFSLGEVAALTFSGAVDLETGLKLVSRRGELMQADSDRISTTMAAVLRLENAVVEDLCKAHGVYPVNYNCPGQISVAGLAEKMPEFHAAVKAAGGRTVPLKVSGGFHSPFMETAAREFGALLETVEFRKPEIALYSNYTGALYDSQIKELLARQICNPVQWEKIIRNMIAAGVDTFFEVGPGNTLSGLIGKIDKTVRTFGVSDKQSLETALQEVKEC